MLRNLLIPRLGPILLATVIALWSRGDRWTVVPATSAFSIHRQEPPTIPATVSIRKTCGRTALLAVNKPKRRKRKTSSNDDGVDDDSLPDFDIADDSSTTASSTVGSYSSSSSSSSSSAASRSKPTSTDAISFNEITPEMMGSSYVKDTTVGDLIRDRSLESKFVFDDEDDADLPDLPMFPNTSSSSSSSEPLVNKKKVRKAASIAAAAAAQTKREEEKEGNLLAKIPFALDEKGEVSALKILENGTWLGIGLLVGWELYINSPFFERAQPMIPVVYDIVWFT